MNGYRRISFGGIANFRDLGGYPCSGGMTRYGVFYRSTHFAKATDHDLSVLEALNIRTVIDLRHPSETVEMPDRLPRGCTYRNISLLGPLEPEDLKVNSSVANTRTLFRMYRQILESARKEIAAVLSLLAESGGPAVFHCAAGKDRTGLIALFLFSIAGADRKDIIADYEVSHTYIKDFTDDISGSNYRNMEKLLDFINSGYGGVSGYLQAAGITEAVSGKIRDGFVEKTDLSGMISGSV